MSNSVRRRQGAKLLPIWVALNGQPGTPPTPDRMVKLTQSDKPLSDRVHASISVSTKRWPRFPDPQNSDVGAYDTRCASGSAGEPAGLGVFGKQGRSVHLWKSVGKLRLAAAGIPDFIPVRSARHAVARAVADCPWSQPMHKRRVTSGLADRDGAIEARHEWHGLKGSGSADERRMRIPFYM